MIKDEVEQVKAPVPGSLSKVPYAEPTWLSEGFHSPYYKQVHSEFLPLWRVGTRILCAFCVCALCRAIGSCKRQCVCLWMRLSIRMVRYVLVFSLKSGLRDAQYVGLGS